MMQAFWTQLDPTAQTALLGLLAGVVLWGIQRFWTNCPALPYLGKTDSVRKKRLVAILASLLPGVFVYEKTGGNWQQAVAAAAPALLASQTAKLWVADRVPQARANADAAGVKDAEEAA